MPAVTQAAYARLRGVSPAAINKAIKSGRIRLNAAGLIDAEAADATYTPEKINAGAALTRAKVATEELRAKRAALDYEERVGSLLDRQEVIESMETIGELIVHDMETLQNSAAAITAAAHKGGERAVKKALKDAVYRVRKTIANNLQRAGENDKQTALKGT